MIINLLKKIFYAYKRRKYKKNNSIEKSCVFGSNVKISNCIFDSHSRAAEYSSIHNTEVGCYSSLGRYSKIVYTKIGKYCAISWDVTINAVSHPHTHLTINAFPYVPRVGNFVTQRNQTYNEVIIKNDVWIGANSVIMPGVIIGNGAIIGAGAVVTKDVPDYAIVVGVPAKVIKYRFSDDIIKRLLELQWWNLDPKVIKQNIWLWQGDFNYESLDKLEEICKS